jgi:hypothetical protein
VNQKQGRVEIFHIQRTFTKGCKQSWVGEPLAKYATSRFRVIDTKNLQRFAEWRGGSTRARKYNR